jgi:serine/threonine protein kinase
MLHLPEQRSTLLLVCSALESLETVTDEAEVCTPDGEISRRPSYVAGPADIWCLGIILGMLLGGQSPPEISHAARNNMVTIRDACSDESYEVLESCLQVDPMHRATIWDIAGHPWLNGV